MRIELKQNRIVIILTEAESSFLAHKADEAGQADVCSYIKAKILKALDLKGFEDSAIVDLANNFNLDKIKHVSKELSQRKSSLSKAGIEDDDADLISEEDLIDEEIEEEEIVLSAEQAELLEGNIDIGDELLADLLDKDLLAGRLPDVGAGVSPPAAPAKAPKSPKHGKKPEKGEH